jgi:cytochrome oxidase Cu insertion factor (SCO1/SenC/PrrC family)
VAVRSSLRLVLPAISLTLAIALILVIVLRTHGGSSSRSSTHTGSPAGSFAGAPFPPAVHAHDFTLTDQRGRRVSLSAYRGQVVALAFLSTHCRACVLMAQQVRGALDELASRPTYGRGTADGALLVMFVSTNSRADTRASVRRFLADTSLSGRVLYLTGSEARLQPIWRAYRIPPPIVDRYPIRGTRRDRRSASVGKSASEAATTVLLIGPSGNERVGFGLEQVTPESLSHDIRLLRDGRTTPSS